jgi:hypothetical protein
MYYICKRDFQKDRIKVLILGIIIGLSLGICGGFLWGIRTIQDLPITIFRYYGIPF